MSKCKCVNIHAYETETDRWLMDIRVDDVTVRNDRTERSYSSAQDAIVSARHAVNEHLKTKKP